MNKPQREAGNQAARNVGTQAQELTSVHVFYLSLLIARFKP